jgi:hypothetical protein
MFLYFPFCKRDWIQLFSLNIDSALGSLQHVDVGRIDDVSEVQTAFTFRVKVSREYEC